MLSLGSDLQLAFRLTAKKLPTSRSRSSPVLALGIGATAAVFADRSS